MEVGLVQRKSAMVVILFLAVVASAYWGYQWFSDSPIDGFEASGTIEATKAEIRTKLPGTVINFDLQQGQKVAKDQLVAAIVRNDLAAQRERDALTVLKAEAMLMDLRSGAKEQEIDEVAAAVGLAQAEYDKVRADYHRAEQLFQQEVLAEAEFNQVEAQLKMADSRLTAANAKLSNVQAGSREKVIDAAKIEVERSKAILKATEAQLTDTEIYSPINGVVLTTNVEAGEFVPLGSSIATVVNLDDMWIKVYVPTDQLPQIKLGQSVDFTVTGSKDLFQGSVVEISSQGEFTPKTIQTKQERTNIVYAVKIKVDHHGGILKPGMPADVRFN